MPVFAPVLHPLCTLVTLTSLRSISITREREGLDQIELEALAELKTIRSLTLRFTHARRYNLDISPLSQLTNLQQLTVAGVLPVPVVDSKPVRALASSLCSLVLEGGGRTLPFGAWLDHLSTASSLQHLQLVDPAMEGFDQVAPNVNWSSLVNLRELYISLPGDKERCHLHVVNLPDAMSALSSLEVLMVDTTAKAWPWSQYVVFADFTLSSLREVGGLIMVTEGIAGAAAEPPLFPHLASFGGYLPLTDHLLSNWASMSYLRHLSLEMGRVDNSTLQELGRLTQVTSLRLSTGFVLVYKLAHAVGTVSVPSWASLEPLGRALVKLDRLELVNCCRPLESQGGAAFIVPDGLSSFTQVKELQLICAVPPTKPLPQQPSQQQLLQGLSVLTQLQQLELSGYNTVTPMLVMGLPGCLPQLRQLKVGLCNHPRVVQARQQQQQVAGGGGGMQPGLGHSSWGEMRELLGCSHPKLSVEVEIAQQWRT